MPYNPVERCIVELRDHWVDFRRDSTKRLLVWRAPDNTSRILQCFFEAQKHESEYATGDLFIVFNSSFENSVQYSRSLKAELAGQYDVSREDLKQQDIVPDWAFNPLEFPDSPNGVIQSLRSFGSKYHKIIGHLVAVLMPQKIAYDEAYSSWLERALATDLPERLRLCVVDSIEHPRWSRLTEARHDLVYVDNLDINTLTVAQETFAQEATVGPAGVFRNYLMGLVTLIERGSLDQIRSKAVDAFTFARKQNWADQEVVIRMLFAGALLKEKHLEAAVKAYEGARQSALQALKVDHPAGKPLVLQTWFGEAGAHLAAGELNHAAECYDQAVDLAEKIPNPILEIEAYRMASFCYVKLGQKDVALARGIKALDRAKRLKPEARAMTTAPLIAIDMLRMIEPERVQSMEDVKYRLDASIKKENELLEQQAKQLDRSGNLQDLQPCEEKFGLNIERAKEEAKGELESLIESATDEFRELFRLARDTLNQQWPLESLSAIPLPASTDKIESNSSSIRANEALSS